MSIEFDFEVAQGELTLADKVVGNDFVFSEFQYEFLDNPRYLISEAYCQIHHRTDLVNLPEKLNLSEEEEEKWIVNLIREPWMGADVKRNLEKVCFHFFPSQGFLPFFLHACSLHFF